MSDYTVYIDEAGDLGIGRGTRWFVLSAVIVAKEDESAIREKNETDQEPFECQRNTSPENIGVSQKGFYCSRIEQSKLYVYQYPCRYNEIRQSENPRPVEGIQLCL